MRTITKNIYKFNELSDKAKDKAREWYLSAVYEAPIAWDYIVENALTTGLVIKNLETSRSSRNEGTFEISAEDTAKRIINSHGKECESYKYADSYMHERKNLLGETLVLDYDEDNGDIEEKLEELNKEFMQNLLEDYRIMHDEECEYQTSDDVVAESIEANEYEFYEDGAFAKEPKTEPESY